MKSDEIPHGMKNAIRDCAVAIGLLAAMTTGCQTQAAATPDEGRAQRSVATMEPEQVVETYFSRMRDADLEVVDLFHDDAVLLGLGKRVSGRKAIEAFYAQAIETGGPQPRPAGPLISDGRRVAAEIYIDLSNGPTLHVVDMFHVEDGRIRLLNYFIADEPAAPESPE